jgi:anthranilate synthase component 2
MSRKILLVDNFDSFTFNVKDYLQQCGAIVTVVARPDVRTSDFEGYDGIVFSPGPGNPADMPALFDLVEHAVNTKPTLGICLGFQAIAFYFGARIRKGVPHHGKMSTVRKVLDGRLLSGLPDRFDVVRYHSLVVYDLCPPLQVLLQTDDQEIMAFEHSQLPVSAVLFHPEAHLTQYGLAIFKNWLNLCA